MHATIRSATALALCAAATACGRPEPGRAGTGAQPAPARGVPISIDNAHRLDVTVYAVRGGARMRLGTVTSLSTGTFTVPPSLAGAGEVRLLLDPIGGGRPFLTDPILVAPGERIELRIGNLLPLSSWTVR